MKIEVRRAKDGVIELVFAKPRRQEEKKEIRDFLAMMRYLATGKKPH